MVGYRARELVARQVEEREPERRQLSSEEGDGARELAEMTWKREREREGERRVSGEGGPSRRGGGGGGLAARVSGHAPRGGRTWLEASSNSTSVCRSVQSSGSEPEREFSLRYMYSMDVMSPQAGGSVPLIRLPARPMLCMEFNINPGLPKRSIIGLFVSPAYVIHDAGKVPLSRFPSSPRTWRGCSPRTSGRVPDSPFFESVLRGKRRIRRAGGRGECTRASAHRMLVMTVPLHTPGATEQMVPPRASITIASSTTIRASSVSKVIWPRHAIQCAARAVLGEWRSARCARSAACQPSPPRPRLSSAFSWGCERRQERAHRAPRCVVRFRSSFPGWSAAVTTPRHACPAVDLGSWILDLETGPNPTDYPRTSANVGA